MVTKGHTFLNKPVTSCYRQPLKSSKSVQRHIQNTPTARKMKFSIKYFFSKCDQIRWNLRIWSHLLKKYLMENLFFCAMSISGVWNNSKCTSETWSSFLVNNGALRIFLIVVQRFTYVYGTYVTFTYRT